MKKEDILLSFQQTITLPDHMKGSTKRITTISHQKIGILKTYPTTLSIKWCKMRIKEGDSIIFPTPMDGIEILCNGGEM